MTEYDVMPAVDCIGDANSRLVDARKISFMRVFIRIGAGSSCYDSPSFLDALGFEASLVKQIRCMQAAGRGSRSLVVQVYSQYRKVNKTC
jgi:hypothetical protein